MKWLHRHPRVLMLIATLIAAGGAAIVATGATWPATLRAWSHLHPVWLLVLLAGAALAILAYVLTYGALLRMRGGPQLPRPLIAQIVAVGFGPFLPAGGFSVDRHALRALGEEPQAAEARVSAIGWLELAVLMPAVAIAAAWELLDGAPARLTSGLTPWVWGVPAGFVVALAAWTIVRIRDLDPAAPGWRGKLVSWLEGVGVLVDGLRVPTVASVAIIGMAAYWACDLASFYAALRFLGLGIDLRLLLVVYGTGYALTRRSMPLGGAAVTEVLMAYSLQWAGVNLAAALAAVIVYRVCNFLLPAVPALLVHQNVKPLLEAEDGELEANPLYLSAEVAIGNEATTTQG